MLKDSKENLVALVIPGLETLRAKLATVLVEIEALFPGELENTNSRDPLYSFLALHYSWYNRYHESVSLHLLIGKDPLLTWRLVS
jgi:hypothetical protein